MKLTLFHNQFALGSLKETEFSEPWKKIELKPESYIHIHPHLPFTIKFYNDRVLALFGDALDPYHPTSTNDGVAEDLIKNSCAINDLFYNLSKLSGRWAIYFVDGVKEIIVGDATGNLPIYYCYVNEKLCCASQPELLSEHVNIYEDNEAKDFQLKNIFPLEKRTWWPGDSTLLSGVKRLLPNYYLDVRDKKTIRYWPQELLKRPSYAESLNKASFLLQGNIESLINRYRVGMALTSGLDSRVLLAASKRFLDKIHYMTFLLPGYGVSDNSPDIYIPRLLARKLAFKHSVFRPTFPVNSNDFDIDILIRGGANEIGRSFYFLKQVFSLDPFWLCYVSKLKPCPFAIKHFSLWINEAREIYEENNIDSLDLFYWEQRMGSWFAESALENDKKLHFKMILIFNCRDYLELMLALPQRFRKPPDHKFHIDLIRNMFPEVLVEPINPHIKNIKLKYFCNFPPYLIKSINQLGKLMNFHR
jgi:hypothetical protein